MQFAALLSFAQGLSLTLFGYQNHQVLQCSKPEPANVSMWMSDRVCGSTDTTIINNTPPKSLKPLESGTSNPLIEFDEGSVSLRKGNGTEDYTLISVTLLESSVGGASTNCLCCLDASNVKSTLKCQDVSLHNDAHATSVCQLAVFFALVHAFWS